MNRFRRPGFLGALLAALLLSAPGGAAPLQDLPFPGPEPAIRWDWDPTAFEPLAHPVRREFTWRLRELRKRNLPEVARARLNLELAFLDLAAAEAGPAELLAADSLGAGRRAREARDLYGRMLGQSPGQPELLVDLGDLYRLLGHPDSALTCYRQALAAPHPPPRLFSRLANAELETLESRADPSPAGRFQEVRTAGLAFFVSPPPANPRRAAAFLLEAARFRADMAILESYADRRLHPDRWKSAGADSLFALLARVVSPETRRLAAEAVAMDTMLAEAHGLLGSLLTGQIHLPIAARALLLRERPVPEDSLVAGLLALARERNAQRPQELGVAAAQLNWCESLEPGRYPRARADLARLALVAGELDVAGGLWRALMAHDPRPGQYVVDLFTVYRMDSTLDAAARLERDLEPLVGRTRDADIGAFLGWARASGGLVDEGCADFGRAAALDSLSWRARLGAAVCALRRLDPAGAEGHLRVAGEHFAEMDDVGRGIYCTAVGLLFRARGEELNARRWLQDAARFDPRNEAAARALAAVAPGSR